MAQCGPAVLGMKERGGRMVAEVVPNVSKKATLRKVVLMTVQPDTIVSTDEAKGYGLLTEDGYEHGRVNHSAEEWVRVDPKTG